MSQNGSNYQLLSRETTKRMLNQLHYIHFTESIEQQSTSVDNEMSEGFMSHRRRYKEDKDENEPFTEENLM